MASAAAPVFSCSSFDRIPYLSVVLYSPNGATRGVCDLAERIKEAIEAKALERNGHQSLERGANEDSFANGVLAYNVFVVTGTNNFRLSGPFFPPFPCFHFPISYLPLRRKT